jgi:hypothetical protein
LAEHPELREPPEAVEMGADAFVGAVIRTARVVPGR